MMNQGASGSQENPSGKTVEQLQEELKAILSNKEEILAEKKKLSQEKAELLAREKAREEKELKDKENFKELLSLREKELETIRSEKNNLLSQFERSQKLDIFLSTLDGKIDSKYWGMIDLEQIKMNDGKVDTMSIASAVDNFKKTYPELIKTGSGPQLPPNAPQGNSSAISVDDWQKLPIKERREKMADVYKNFTAKK